MPDSVIAAIAARRALRPAAPEAATGLPRRLRIATYNIHKGMTAFNLRCRADDLRVALATLEADIVFLQEVQEVHRRHALRFANWPAEPQTQYLAGTEYHSVYARNAVYEHGHHGNAVLALQPFAEARNHDVSDHAWESRGLLHVVQRHGADELHLVNVHLGLFAGSRRRQTDALIALVREQVPAGAALIIAGDFNDWHNRLNERICAELGVCEAMTSMPAPRGGRLRGLLGAARAQALEGRPARTFPALLPWLTLDRIYVRGFAVEHAAVMGGRLWARMSDHAPLVADLIAADAARGVVDPAPPALHDAERAGGAHDARPGTASETRAG
ncbi:endonuclease/exonuclease/phosphatase family protein [Derxia gummosa]|uniref:Endonuclease/exonuclease/phosphatase family protein n=1 Tax=Derxia gummosa DSM 723 TaxID=1121388 RepID=A0A8B6XAH3_9BURK|nr:endonuclease/exonuclease/phosphatase family protein [Derxia gummosa]